MRFTWRRPGDKGRAGNAGEQEAPLLEPASPPLSVPSTSTLKAYSRMPLRDDMFNPNQVEAFSAQHRVVQEHKCKCCKSRRQLSST